MVVTRQDRVPLFHCTYEGNLQDSKVFQNVLRALKKRMQARGLAIGKHTLVFDRGNPSTANLAQLKDAQSHYVGALTPYPHQTLVKDAMAALQECVMDEPSFLPVYRDKRLIWGEERTVIVTLSEKLKAGQLRGLYPSLARAEKQRKALQAQLGQPQAKKRDTETLKDHIKKMTAVQFIKPRIEWSLTTLAPGKYPLHYTLNQDLLSEQEARLGFRILMTDHHHWATQAIIQAYQGQSKIEPAFKELKNPHPLAIKPQFHWTAQKIHGHYFMGVLGYLLTTRGYRQVKTQGAFEASMNRLLETLNQIRWATLPEQSTTTGKMTAVYKREEMTDAEQAILRALDIDDFYRQRSTIKGVGVYT